MSRSLRLIVPLLVALLAGLLLAGGSPATAAQARAPRVVIAATGINARVIPTRIVAGIQETTTSTRVFFHPKGSIQPGQSGHSVFAAHFCHFACSHGLGNQLAQLKVGNRVKYIPSHGAQVCGTVYRLKSLKHVSARLLNRLYNTVDGPSIGIFITCRLTPDGTQYKGSKVAWVRWGTSC
jgi:hypothetical protein